MVNRQKNLLEAFTASANAEKAASEDPAAVEGAPSGGPFAPGSGRDDLDRARGSLADTLLHPENRGGLIALVGVLITLAFLAGRMTMEEKEAVAAESALADSVPASQRPSTQELPTTAAQREQPVPAEVPASAPITAFEKALSDPRNRYTIKLIEYQDKDKFRDLAWNTLNYLEDQGIEAATLYRGKALFIVVGAKANQVDLDGLLERVRTMPGPPPQSKRGEFVTAYVEKIDNLFDR